MKISCNAREKTKDSQTTDQAPTRLGEHTRVSNDQKIQAEKEGDGQLTFLVSKWRSSRKPKNENQRAVATLEVQKSLVQKFEILVKGR